MELRHLFLWQTSLAFAVALIAVFEFLGYFLPKNLIFGMNSSVRAVLFSALSLILVAAIVELVRASRLEAFGHEEAA
jgi:hypothetical protein